MPHQSADWFAMTGRGVILSGGHRPEPKDPYPLYKENGFLDFANATLGMTPKGAGDETLPLRLYGIRFTKLQFTGLLIHKSTARPERCLLISLGVLGEAQQVVHGNVVEIGELNKNIGRNIPLAQLVVAVDPLGAV